MSQTRISKLRNYIHSKKINNSKKNEFLKESEEISIKTHVLLGHPADKIIEFADTEKVELIVMGTLGLRGISKIKAVGSVTRRVAEVASCPILLVH